MKIKFQLPRVGRRRAITTGVLSATTSALFITPSMAFPGAQSSPMIWLAGIALPAGVSALTLVLMEQRITRDLKPVDRREMPTREQVSAR